MFKKGYSITSLANSLGITRTSLSKKLNNKSSTGFTQKEMENIGVILDIDEQDLGSYFFVKLFKKLNKE